MNSNMLRRPLSRNLASNCWKSLPQGLLPDTLINFNPSQTSGACRYRSNRSRRGLYDGKDIRSGNNVSFSMKATKRKFKPNVFKKKVYSEVLDEMVPFHLTTSALRSIDKAGGLDSYLLTSKHITSGEGLEAKKKIISKLKLNEKVKRWEAEAAATTTTTTENNGGESIRVE